MSRDSDPPADPGKGPNGCCRRVAWYGAVSAGPDPEAAASAQTLPAGTTMLDALLLAPLSGSG